MAKRRSDEEDSVGLGWEDRSQHDRLLLGQMDDGPPPWKMEGQESFPLTSQPAVSH